MCVNLSMLQVLGASQFGGLNSSIIASLNKEEQIAYITYMMLASSKKGTLGGFFFYPGYDQYELIKTGPTADPSVEYVNKVVDSLTPKSRSVMSFGMDKGVGNRSSQFKYLDGIILEANNSDALRDQVIQGAIDKRFVSLLQQGGEAALEASSKNPKLSHQSVIGRFYEIDNNHGVVMSTYKVPYNGSDIIIPLWENNHTNLGDFPEIARRDTNVIVGFSDPRNQYLPAIDNLVFFMPPGFDLPNGNLLVDTSANAVGVKYGAEFIPSESQYQIIA